MSTQEPPGAHIPITRGPSSWITLLRPTRAPRGPPPHRVGPPCPTGLGPGFVADTEMPRLHTPLVTFTPLSAYRPHLLGPHSQPPRRARTTPTSQVSKAGGQSTCHTTWRSGSAPSPSPSGRPGATGQEAPAHLRCTLAPRFGCQRGIALAAPTQRRCSCRASAGSLARSGWARALPLPPKLHTKTRLQRRRS